MFKYFQVLLLLSVVPRCASAERAELIIRGQSKLTLVGAERVAMAARDRAAALHVAENIAVVDEGGHLLMFYRMDGARPASATTAITKATSAATMRRETGPVFTGSVESNMLNLAIEHAAAANGGRLTILSGGIPILVDGQVIGAIGVGGGTEDQDVTVGKAGVAALQSALAERANLEKRE